MFVRRKKNRSGSTSVVVVDKHGGKFKEIHTVGIAHYENEVNLLYEQGRAWIRRHLGIQELDFERPANRERERIQTEAVLDSPRTGRRPRHRSSCGCWYASMDIHLSTPCSTVPNTRAIP